MLPDDLDALNFVNSADEIKPEDQVIGDNSVHIRIKQRGRKHITFVYGLPKAMDLEPIIKDMKKKFACIGCAKEDEDTQEMALQFSGDQRTKVKDYLVQKKLVDAANIMVHGY